jgi:hypothetical protein
MINEVLLAAAQYMDEHGKAVFVLEDDSGRVCIFGAINAVMPRVWGSRNPQEVHKLEKHLEDYARAWGIGHSVDYIVTSINDHILETKEETVKFMMDAAEWEPSK